MQTRLDNESAYDKSELLELALLTTIGNREEQQDNVGYLLGNNDGLIVLCDGMGGYADGKKAGITGVTTILENFEEISQSENVIQSMQAVTMLANEKVATIGTNAMTGATEICVYIRNNELYWNSVGDSRGYVIRNGRYHQFTQDHNMKTVLDEKLATGIISRQDYETQIVTGEALISYLGMKTLGLIDYNMKPFQLISGDVLVMMSDGVYKYLNEDTIFQIIDNFIDVSDAVNALESRVKRESISNNKSRDNMTVVVIRIR